MPACCDPGLNLSSPLDVVLLAGAGLTISLGHCVGMCGPIVTAYGVGQENRDLRGWRRIPPLALYHGGRLVSYATIGAVLAAPGAAARLAGSTGAFQGVLSLLVGVAMFILGLGILGLIPTDRILEAPGPVRRLHGRIGRLFAAETPPKQLALGVLNGFLPCGPVLAVALSAAAAGTVPQAMGAMAIYGAGTVPVLAILGTGAGRLSPRTQQRFHRLAAGLVMLIALQLTLRGAASFGWVPHLEWGKVVIW